MSIKIQGKLNHTQELIESDVNMALKVFSKCLSESIKCMEKKVFHGRKAEARPWFDGRV